MRLATKALLGAAAAVPAVAVGSGYAIATPRNVARLLAELLAPEPQHTIYDPCCGSGRLLLAADDVRRRGTGVVGTAFGQEIQPVPAARAKRALDGRGTPCSIAGGSSLTDPAFLDTTGRLLPVDRALANPNWGRPVRPEVYTEDTHNRFPFGRPPLAKGDWCWAQHLLAHLKPDGTAVMMIGQEITSRDGDALEPTAERELRERLVRAGHLRTVVSNPWPLSRRPGLQTLAGRAWLPRASVLVFSKQPTSSGVLMIDLTAPLRRYQGLQLSAEQVTTEVGRLHRERADRAGTSTLVDTKRLATQGFDLTPALYV